jgi:hypothetical protein
MIRKASVPFQSQINSFQTVLFSCFKIHSKVIFPTMCRSFSLFLYKFLHRTMCAFSSLSYVLCAQSTSFSSIWSPECYLGMNNNHEASRYVSLFDLLYIQIPSLAACCQTASAYGLSLIRRPHSHLHKTKGKIKILDILISCVLVY